MLSPARRIEPDRGGVLEPVVLLCGESSGRTRIARTLHRCLGRTAFVEGLDALVEKNGVPVLALHNDGLTPQERVGIVTEAKERVQGPLVVVLAKPLPRPELAELLGRDALRNKVVLAPSGVDASDLLVTLDQLRRGPRPGLEPWLGQVTTWQSCSITTSHQREGAMAWVDAFAQDLGVPSRVRSLLRVITDEVLTNALYNAPVSTDGTHRFAARPRTEPVELPDHLAIELTIGCDGERFGLSSRDPFGSLSAERVQGVLARGFRGGADQVAESTGGAGLGLYRILDAVTHMIVNLHPGQSTEILGILDVRGSYRDLAGRGSSFNTFVNGVSR